MSTWRVWKVDGPTWMWLEAGGLGRCPTAGGQGRGPWEHGRTRGVQAERRTSTLGPLGGNGLDFSE